MVVNSHVHREVSSRVAVLKVRYTRVPDPVTGGGGDAGPCLTESKNESRGQQRASKVIEFIEGKCKAFKSERSPDWVAAEDFCP